MSDAQSLGVAVAMLTEVAGGRAVWQRLQHQPLHGYCLISGDRGETHVTIYLEPGASEPGRTPSPAPVLQGRLIWLLSGPPLDQPGAHPGEEAARSRASERAHEEEPGHESAGRAESADAQPTGEPPAYRADDTPSQNQGDASLQPGENQPSRENQPLREEDQRATHPDDHPDHALGAFPASAPAAEPPGVPLPALKTEGEAPPKATWEPAGDTAPTDTWEPEEMPGPESHPGGSPGRADERSRAWSDLLTGAGEATCAEPVSLAAPPEASEQADPPETPQPEAQAETDPKPRHPPADREMPWDLPPESPGPSTGPAARTRKVQLESRHPLAARAAGLAQVDLDSGTLTLTLRALPNPIALGREPRTNRPYNAYRAWLLSHRGAQPFPAGICTRVWGENYRFESEKRLPLARYDTILITAEDRTAPSPNPQAPPVLRGSYRGVR